MAECHPVGFQWVMEAKARGATIIHVDPRFTRTSAVADIHVPLRAGTDIAFLGGLINYVLEQRHVSSATTSSPTPTRRRSCGEDFRDTEDLDGLFSGFDPDTAHYDPTTWQYEGTDGRGRGRPARRRSTRARPRRRRDVTASERRRRHGGEPRAATTTLQHPRCVFQILKRHFARYTPEMVERGLRHPAGAVPAGGRGAVRQLGPGAHRGLLLRRRLDPAHRRRAVHPHRGDPAAAARQHRPARRRHHGPARPRQHPGLDRHPDAVQPPARLPPDAARRTSTTTSTTYIEADARHDAGSGATCDAYIVSLLKAWWGDAATADNDFCFDYLPRLTGDHSHLPDRARA